MGDFPQQRWRRSDPCARRPSPWACWRLLGQLPPAVQAQAAWCVDVGNHLLYARADFSGLDAASSASWLAALRKPALGLGGYAVVMATPHADLDRWGYTPDGLELMRAIKNRWDANGILNPGDFVVG